jgi:3-oxoacyl-[acyl-carrier-protein] synthase III
MSDRIPMTILGMGSAVPERAVTNADFEKRLDTSDEWIRERTGIRERRIVGPGENTLTLAAGAARAALADAKLTPADLDMIVVATCTPVTPVPATACWLQAELGCGPIAAFDVSAACSGFVYALVTATCMLNAGLYRRILVIGAEMMSSITDMEDRTVCILLGDGAGAAIIAPAEDATSGLYAHCLGADGSGAQMIWVPAGGSGEPSSLKTVNERMHYLKMKGREVYKFAVVKLQEMILSTVAAAGISINDLALIVPHQSNLRIIESAAQKLGLPPEKVAINIDRLGNTSAASIPLAMDEAWRAGRIKRGDWILLAGIGAGLTWGTALLRL